MIEKTQAAHGAGSGGSGRNLTIAIAVAGVFAVGMVVLWGMQLTGGLVQTGMRNLNPWGLYITNFMFFIGLSAGGLIISSIPKALGMQGFGGIAKVAIWTSICSTVVAGSFIVIDLGGPARLWEFLVSINFYSPLAWDVCVISTYLVLSIVYLWATLRCEAGRFSHVAMRVISCIALVVAVFVHTVTAWILALANAHEFWHTALMGPWFVSSALVCGTALVLVVVIALRKVGYLDVQQAQIERLAKMLGAFCCVDLYFFGCDLITSGYTQGEGLAVVQMLTSGVLAPFFWTEVIACALCAVVCFIPKLRRTGLIATASLLAIIGIFCKRVQLIVGGFQIANIDMAQPVTAHSVMHWESGFDAAFSQMIYWPTGFEFALTACVIGFGVFVFLLGIKLLPLKPREDVK